MSPILSENLVKWQRVTFLSEKIRQIKVAQKLKLKIMAKRNDSSTPLILRFTTWLRDNPYGMAACQPDVFIKLDDKSEHPALKNVLIIHSKFFRRLFGLDPDQMHYELPDVKKESSKPFWTFATSKPSWTRSTRKITMMYGHLPILRNANNWSTF